MTTAIAGTTAADPWKAVSVVIAGVNSETPGVATYDLAFRNATFASSYRFRPGQFNMLYLPGVGESAISISGCAEQRESIPHTVRIAGNVTHALARLKEGDSLGLRGPFGSGWPIDECVGRDVVIVAGGIGLAPLRPVIYAFVNHPQQYGKLTVLCGARSPEHLLYQNEFASWRDAGIDVDVTVDRSTQQWNGNVGVVPLLLDRLVLSSPENTSVFVCGPDVMMWYAVKAALGRGIAAEHVWLNLERNMNCAIGLCGHCQYGPSFLCKDGPVLRYDLIKPLLRVSKM